MPTTLQEAVDFYNAHDPKGEYVLVLEGKSLKEQEEEKKSEWRNTSIEDHMLFYEQKGLNSKEAMKSVAVDRGVSKRDIYQYLNEKKETD